MRALIIILVLFAIKSNAQTNDTIPCHLLYRTKAGQVGVVKGWEVRKTEVIQIPDMSIMDNFGNTKPVTYKEILAPKHITYLRYNRQRFPKGTEVWKLEQPIKQ